MSVITMRVSDKLMYDLDHCAKISHLGRSEYIRQAIERQNAEMILLERSERLKKASLRVRKDSMVVNKEFDRIEDDIKD